VVIWFCGLPGSGKTSIARAVSAELERQYHVPTILLSMDSLRRKIFPNPRYTDEERDAAYRAFVVIASALAAAGRNVIMDGTGHKRVWREFARSEIPRFVEAYVKCPVEICIERETKRTDQPETRKQLYLDALQRLKTAKSFEGLGKVPGVDELFEESPKPDLLIDSSDSAIAALAELATKRLREIRPELFSSK
jgi:adenylylsulfate kinase